MAECIHMCRVLEHLGQEGEIPTKCPFVGAIVPSVTVFKGDCGDQRTRGGDVLGFETLDSHCYLLPPFPACSSSASSS